MTKTQRGLTLIEFLITASIVGLALLIGNDLFSSEAQAKRESKRKAGEQQKIEDERPRKISEANGCEVWAFNPGARWQYFTRCGSSTQTTNTWEECRTVMVGKLSRTECTPHSSTVTQEPQK